MGKNRTASITRMEKSIKAISWYPGETLNVGIGQGYFLATPLQLANATSLLASGGRVLPAFIFEKHR